MSLANILDVCLEDIQSGAATIEDCLARYPEHAPELEPLLEMAVFLERAAPPKPAPAFKAALRRQLMDAPIPESTPATAPALSGGVNGHGSLRPAAPQAAAVGLAGLRSVWARVIQSLSGGLAGWAPRLVTGAALLFFLTVWLSTTTFAAGSLPGEPLYSVKRASEQVRLALALNPFDRAQLHARLAAQRLQEAEALAARGQTTEAEGLIQEAKREQAQAVALGLQITIVEPTATPAPPTPSSSGLSAYPSPSATAPRPTLTLAPSATLTRIAPIGVPTQRFLDGPASVASATAAPPSPVPPSPVPLVTATAVLPLPTRTAVVAVAAASYPSPTAPPPAYPVPPSPTAAPPTDTPISRPPQPTARPLASATNTPGSVISNPGASATPTPPPSATPTPQPRPQRTPVPLPTRTSPPPTETSAPAPTSAPTATSRPPASPTPAPPQAPSATPVASEAATDTPAPPPAPTQGATPRPTATP